MDEQPQEQTVKILQEVPNEPRRAFETVDNPFEGKMPLYKVGDKGTPEGKINVDLKAKDLQALWSAREPYLWFAILICSGYFLLVMAAY